MYLERNWHSIARNMAERNNERNPKSFVFHQPFALRRVISHFLFTTNYASNVCQHLPTQSEPVEGGREGGRKGRKSQLSFGSPRSYPNRLNSFLFCGATT